VVKEIDPQLVTHSAPSYSFTNAMGLEQVEGTHICYLSPNDEPGWVRSEQRYRGKFHEAMELAAFPFDAQLLQMTLRMPTRKDSGRKFEQYQTTTGPQAECKDWVTLSEWLIYEPTARCNFDSKRRARYTISIPVVRKSGYYVWTVLAVISSICFLSFTAFAIDPEYLDQRMSIVLTLLLTAVAFKLVVADMLPKVSYWTVLDIYVNSMFAMLFVISIENGAIAILAKFTPYLYSIYGDNIELGSFLFVFALWVSFHIWFRLLVKRVSHNSMTNLVDPKAPDEPINLLNKLSLEDAAKQRAVKQAKLRKSPTRQLCCAEAAPSEAPPAKRNGASALMC